MPSIQNNNENNDSGGDEDMSDASNSSNAKSDSSEAESDDSSELDENECDRRTAGFVKYMGELIVGSGITSKKWQPFDHLIVQLQVIWSNSSRFCESNCTKSASVKSIFS